MDDPSTGEQSHFLRLPFELRQQVYTALFRSQAVRIGSSHHPRQISPPITRTSSLIRAEALEAYYANVRFIFNLQSDEQANESRAWMKHSTYAKERAFNKLRRVVFIVGQGLCERPQEVEIDLHESRLVSVRRQLPAQNQKAGEGKAFDQLRSCLDDWRHRPVEPLDIREKLWVITFTLECLA